MDAEAGYCAGAAGDYRVGNVCDSVVRNAHFVVTVSLDVARVAASLIPTGDSLDSNHTRVCS